MNNLVPIDKAGRVILPKHIRDELAINPGDRLIISIHGNEVTLRPTREASGFVKRGRALVFSSGEADSLENQTVESVRAEERSNVLSNMVKGLSSSKGK